MKTLQLSPTLYRREQEEFLLRPASSADAPALAELKRAVWPDEESDPRHMAGVLTAEDHLTVVAETAGRLVGFLDNFITYSPQGERWEVDLLGVHPGFRGRRIAEAMVRASLLVAPSIPARALIQTGNIASQTTFSRCGFSCAEPIQRLYVCSEGYLQPAQPSPQAVCLFVNTLNYAGYWLEKSFTIADLQAARGKIKNGEADLAGAVIPANQTDDCQNAGQCGYQFIAEYQWWERNA